jgi:hypothetical protein
MKYFILAGALVLMAAPMFGQVQVYSYAMPCDALWPAVRDTVRNSGKYAPLLLDSREMVASFAIAGIRDTFAVESVVLDPTSIGCSLRVVSPGLGVDNGDLKKQVDKSLAKLKSAGQEPAK